MDNSTYSVPTSTFLLKVLSGPHQGAEVALHDGILSIGSDPSCDLILSDSLLKEKHLELNVQGKTLTFKPLQEPVYLDGKPLPLEQHTLNPYQFLTLGTTHIVIGLQAESWPKLDIPQLQALPTPTVPSSNLTDAKPTEPGVPSIQLQPDSTPQSTTQNVQKDKPKKSTPSQKRLLKFLTFIFIAIVIPVFFIKRSASNNGSRVTHIKDITTIQQQLEAILPKLGYIDQLAIKRSGASIEVIGYVENDTLKRDAMNIIANISRSIQITLWSEEEIIRNCEDMLMVLDLQLKTHAYGFGGVQISGYHYNRAQWFAAKQSLLQDILGLKYIKDEVITEKEVKAQSQNVLLEYELNDKITITADPAGIIAKGSIPSSLTPAWREAKLLLAQRLGSEEIPLMDYVKIPNTAGLEKIFFDSKIESVTIDDDMSWLKLHNGSTYFQGSGLPSGYTIESIKKDGVVLKRGKDSVLLKIGEK